MPKPRAKGNRLERDVMRALLLVDGVCPVFGHLASTTGRTGHLVDLQIDGISRSFVVETKNRESLPLWLWKAVNQLEAQAPAYKKEHLTVVKRNRMQALAIVEFNYLLELLQAVRENGLRSDRGDVQLPESYPSEELW